MEILELLENTKQVVRIKDNGKVRKEGRISLPKLTREEYDINASDPVQQDLIFLPGEPKPRILLTFPKT